MNQLVVLPCSPSSGDHTIGMGVHSFAYLHITNYYRDLLHILSWKKMFIGSMQHIDPMNTVLYFGQLNQAMVIS